VPRIDRLELRSVDGDARCTEQIKLAAQPNELAANLTNGLAIVLAEIRDGLEVRRQLPGQPDHLDIALALPLQASARRHPIEVAIDVEFEHRARMVARSARVEWLDADEAELVEIKPVHEHVDRANGIVLAPVVTKHCRDQCPLPPTDPYHEPGPRSLLPPPHRRIIADTAEAEFSHRLGHFRTNAVQRVRQQREPQFPYNLLRDRPLPNP